MAAIRSLGLRLRVVGLRLAEELGPAVGHVRWLGGQASSTAALTRSQLQSPPHTNFMLFIPRKSGCRSKEANRDAGFYDSTKEESFHATGPAGDSELLTGPAQYLHPKHAFRHIHSLAQHDQRLYAL